MTRPARLLAAGFLVACAAIHLYLVPEHTDAEHQAMGHAYVGWLFLASGEVLVVVAVGIALADHPWAWNAGAVLCAAMIAALLASRTVGLPNSYLEEWEPLAVWSLVTEAGFLALFAVRVVRRQSVTSVGRTETR